MLLTRKTKLNHKVTANDNDSFLIFSYMKVTFFSKKVLPGFFNDFAFENIVHDAEY